MTVIPARALKWIVSLAAISMSLYHLHIAGFGPPEAMILRSVHLAFAMGLVFLLYPTRARREGEGLHVIDLALVLASLVATGHILWNYNYFINRIAYIDDLTTFDMAMAALTVVLVLEATRRVIGLALPITALIFLGFTFFIAGIEPQRVMEQMYASTEGIFGSTLGVSATYVIVFVLFGSFMERSGTGQLFMDFALSLTGHTAGGPGKVAVVSSSLFGTISGSAVANVMVDGPITIPLMKRTGFRPPFAAAVEAVASTGGQIMPPIMGAAAFVMAEFLAVSYFQVTLWALIPAVLYYIAVFFAVHFEAKRHGLSGVPRADLPRLSRVMIERGHLFIPVLVILTGMMMSYSAPLCALYGLIATLPVALLRKTTRGGISFRTVIEALEDGARNALAVAMACAAAGIIIGCIALTGAGITFTQIVLAAAQNTLVLALALTAIAGIVLGMGMPTTPAYIVMVSLLVPALIKLGVVTPAAHMFAFYFAILSAITPPVALATFAAASLAKADLWKSGWASMKVGAAGFIVPFMFAYEPALLMVGDWETIVSASFTACIGVILLAAGLHSYMLAHCKPWERIALIIAAVLLIKPGIYTDIAGFGLGALVVARQYLANTSRKTA